MYDLATIVSRLAAHEAHAATDDAHAAVAAIFRAPTDHAEAQVLLIRRAEREGDPWSGHMAFPGGKRDASDASLLDTAIRETQEEIGLDLQRHAHLVTRLSNVKAMRRGMVVAPFIFALDEPEHPTFAFSSEVADAFWTPIGPIARGETATTFPYNYEGNLLQLPGFLIRERIVWGFTHRTLTMLLTAIG